MQLVNFQDKNNASMIQGADPSFAQIISWDIDGLLLIMWAIIETRGLSKSFHIFCRVKM